MQAELSQQRPLLLTDIRCRRRDVRTSQGTFVSRAEDPDGVLAWVEEKTAQITGIPSGHGEVGL